MPNTRVFSFSYVDSDAYASTLDELEVPAQIIRKSAALFFCLGLYSVYTSGVAHGRLRSAFPKTVPPSLTPARQTQACGHIALAFAMLALVDAGVISSHFRKTGSGGMDVRVFNESAMAVEAFVFLILAILLAKHAEQLPTRVEITHLRVRTPASSEGLRNAYLVALLLGVVSGVVCV